MDLTIVTNSDQDPITTLLWVNHRLCEVFPDWTTQLVTLQNCQLLKIFDNRTGVEVDLTINATLSLWTAELIRAYGAYNFVAQTAVYLKMWNKAKFPNRTNRISSHGIVLMLIAYLQSIGVLPCLQKNSSQQTRIVKVVLIGYQGYIRDRVNTFFSQSDSSDFVDSKCACGELLRGFFDFYASFDFKNRAVDISKDK